MLLDASVSWWQSTEPLAATRYPAGMEPTVEHVEDVAARAAALFTETMLASVRERGRFTTTLSGGSTPLPLYRLLAARPDLPWDRAHICIGDERFVTDTHEDSNFRAIRGALLDHVPVPPDQVHPWPIEGDPARSAEAYREILDETLKGQPFDLTLLGLGTDGHTAGIFPDTADIRASTATTWSEPSGVEHRRLSLTPRRLSESRTVAFLVSGEEKRAALDSLLAAEGARERTPARAITALERLLVITDVG
jgi:6-phosphogluconolactonase